MRPALRPGRAAVARLVRRLPALAALAAGLAPRPAAADWLLIPYAGVRFGGSTAFIGDLERGAEVASYTLGGSVAFFSAGVFGVEADLGLTPGFFDRAGVQNLVKSSRVTSVSGSVVVTLPLAVTRESLRPYVTAGGGLLLATAVDLFNEFPIRATMPALVLGGGAVGFFSDTTGVRFDLRLLRSLGRGDEPLDRPGSRLRYWRATAGLVRRF